MKKILGFLCALLLVFGVVANVQAIPLGDLFGGATITVGDKVFADWQIFFLDSNVMPDVFLIDVQPLADQPLNPGLRFTANGQLTVADDTFIKFGFGFSVATLSGEPLIKDNSVELLDFSFAGAGGKISVAEDVLDPAGNLLAVKEVFADNALQDFQLFDEEAFDPQALIFVEKTIVVFGDFAGDLVNLEVFDQRFSQVPEPVPEPATMLLIGTGLVGLAGFRRKFRK
jgi:hypothetical protein